MQRVGRFDVHVCERAGVGVDACAFVSMCGRVVVVRVSVLGGVVVAVWLSLNNLTRAGDTFELGSQVLSSHPKPSHLIRYSTLPPARLLSSTASTWCSLSPRSSRSPSGSSEAAATTVGAGFGGSGADGFELAAGSLLKQISSPSDQEPESESESESEPESELSQSESGREVLAALAAARPHAMIYLSSFYTPFFR